LSVIVDWAVEVGDRCSQAVLARMGPDAVWLPADETRRGIEASVVAVLRRIGLDAQEFTLNREQISLAHKMARHGLPYERYMDGLRLAQEITLEALLDALEAYRPAHVRPWLPAPLSLAMSRFFDESAGAIVAEYLAEQQRAIARTVAHRRRTVAALIAGDHVPDDEAGRALGISLGHHHLAVILWTADQGQPAGSRGDLEAAAARAAAALRSARHFAIPDERDESALLCWLSAPVPFPAEHVAAVSRVLATGQFRAAVGAPGQGAAGFRATYLAARDAQRVAREGLPGKVTAYRDVDIVALLTVDPERAKQFVIDHLGGLAAQHDEALSDLRATALCFLESCYSLVRTAAALHIHRNTVLYRLASIERLLGRELAASPLATHAALVLAQRLGGALLDRDFTPRPPGETTLADATYL
jgi:DNA-binding PucR family transcriptional regulator